jgi:tetratricopeptide (TPR) repeat protein
MHHTAFLAVLLSLAACEPTAATVAPSTPTVEAGPPVVELDDLSIADSDDEAQTPISGPPALAREAIPHHDPRFHDHFQEAVILREEGDPGAAVDALRLALFDAPDSAVAWQLLGETYLDLGRRSQGLDCVSQALVADPDLVPAHEVLAEDLLERGEPKAARTHADRLVALRPGSARAHLLQARSFLGLSMWSQAIDASRRAIARDPQQVQAYNALGFAALQVRRDGLALQYLEAATELPGLQAHMVNNLGIAYERAGRDLDALEAFAKAAKMRPGYATAEANRDRLREAVDREVADEVARILSERVGERGEGHAAADPQPTDEATP